MSVHERQRTDLEAVDRLRELPQFAEAAVPLPVLAADGGRDPRAHLTRAAELFGRTSAPLSMAVRIGEGEQARPLFLDAGPDGTRLADQPAKQRLDLDVTTDADTWQELSAGRLTPLEAFAGGRMRLRGDVTTAMGVLRKLRRGDGTDSEGN